MSWLFSQALVEEYLGENSLDGEQSAPLSGNHTQQAYCAPDKMTVFSRLSRFGMSYKPLTETRGEELLTLYRAAFHAKTYQPQGGAGIDGERSGMWREMARIICEVQPRFVFVENSPMLTSRGLGRVLGDLASMGFDARWGVLGAADVGANHQRNRIWIVGDSSRKRRAEGRDDHGQDDGSKPATDGQHASQMADALCNGLQGIRPNGTVEGSARLRCRTGSNQIKQLRHTASEGLSNWINGTMGQPRTLSEFKRPSWWSTEPNVGRVAHGVAARVDRLKAIGNGQVPLCAATAWRILSVA